MAGEVILVIDDGQDNREFIVDYVLKPNGYRYLLAADGQEGFLAALKHRPDLILLDLQMPRMNGIEVLESLNENDLDIPVILMTFHGSEEIATEVYRMGVKDYIIKPYAADEMLDAMEKALSETRLKREKEALTKRVLQANHELQRRLRELKTLYTVGKSVTSMMNMDQLLPHIVESAVQLTNAEEGLLCLVEDKRLICRAHRDQRMTQARAVAFEVNDPMAIHAAKTRQVITLSGEQLQKAPLHQRPTSVAYAPLLLGERVLGVLGVANFTPGSDIFTGDDGNLLSALGDYASIAIGNSRNYAALQASKERMLHTFERFVSPNVVHRALSRPDGVRLGGQRQEVSIVFADIRGYTTWSENAEPEQVVETLNHYLSLAAGVIIGWEGTLDKFFGDGLMAIFNAPERQENHVYKAVEASLAIMKAAQEVNLIHGHQLSYSIGVHVGEAVVGYIGSEDAMNYTAIGDTVNLAKRLQESASPNQILLDEAVVRRLGNQIQVRPLGELRVKGRRTPTIAYELLDLKPHQG